MSLADAMVAWLTARHGATATPSARRLVEARLAGDTAITATPDEIAMLRATGAAADDPATAPLTVHGATLAWSACARDEADLAVGLATLAEAPPTPASAAQRRLAEAGADPAQDAAVRLAVERRLAIVVGGPGTGKTTTVLRALAALLAGGDRRIALAAPTGKAAARLRSAIEAGLERVPAALRPRLAAAAAGAATLHRLLGWEVGQARFRHRRGQPLPAEVVVIDEASMLDVHLAAAVLRALAPSARLLLVGDDGQLPSVEAGAVLRDAVAGLPGSVARLATVHRQSDAGAGLRRLCPALRAGEAGDASAVLAAGGDVALLPHAAAWADLQPRLAAWARAVVGAADPAAALAALGRLLVLAAVREGPWSVADLHQRIEAQLGARVAGLHPQHAHGRPLLVVANDHRLGLSNGDVGVLWETEGRLLACFPDGAGGIRRLAPARLPACETGWAATVHKAQGGEAAEVIAVLPPAPHPLASRELVYTAITRARERAVLVGDPGLLAAALARREGRVTTLALRLA